ncbi:MAG: ubiquinone/menaquinone biosynthesis methyltransferase [Fimbriimonadales bacterium]
MAENAAPRPWEVDGEEKRRQVRRMFADISPTYDLLNSAISLRLHHRWRADAVKGLRLRAGDVAADLCCGTGDFGRALRNAVSPSGRIIGVDFCMPMLEIARHKPYDMGLSLGDACAIPLRSSSFDGVTVGWGLRNVPDADAALSQIVRILKPGGRFVCVDMARPRSRISRGLSHFVFNMAVPAMGSLFGKREAYTYLPKSTDRFTTREGLAKAMRCAGLKNIRYEDRFFGNICIQWGEK